MINKLIEGIATKLNSEYPDYNKYIENVPQGFKEPCFFIKPLNPQETKVMKNRYKKQIPCVIQCFSENNTTFLYDVAEKLYYILEYINLGEDLIRGIKPKFEIVDDVLHFFINYNFYVLKVPSTEYPNGDGSELMEVLDLNVKAVE